MIVDENSLKQTELQAIEFPEENNKTSGISEIRDKISIMKKLTIDSEPFPEFTKYFKIEEASFSDSSLKKEEDPKKPMKIPKLNLNPVSEDSQEEQGNPKKIPKLMLDSVIDKPLAPLSKSSRNEKSSNRAKTSKTSNPSSRRKVFENPPLSERWSKQPLSERKGIKDDYDTQWVKMNIDESIKQKILKKKSAIKNVAISKIAF